MFVERFLIVLSSILFLVAAFVISSGIKSIGIKNANYITVKGASEREVSATSLSWRLSYELFGNTLEELNKLHNEYFGQIKDFFMGYGFSEDEIKVSSVSLNASNYRDVHYKYSKYISLLVFTKDVDKIAKMEQISKDIVQFENKGIPLNHHSGPVYNFDDIDNVSPDMLADSVQNAFELALGSARRFGVALGKLKTVNQEKVELLPIDRSENVHSSYQKKILRVVTTVAYYLD
ncbi:SIMPL domain-containing protein [Borrelia persica]|uniref:SIMPL domain-containing protein n=1 Tax=Borrelia persica TaxID=44448 RepID=UPI000465B19D|nr:SIMPL domain-containing protein [Borrelia persica]